MRKETSVYLDGGRGQLLSESSRLLDNVTKRFRKNKQRQEQQANLEMDARYFWITNQKSVAFSPQKRDQFTLLDAATPSAKRREGR